MNLEMVEIYLFRKNVLQDFKFMRPQAASFGRAHGAPKTHKDFTDLPTFRSMVDTTTTPHYNVGKFLALLLNPLTLNQFNLNDTFDAVSKIKAIPTGLFDELVIVLFRLM